MIEIKTPPKRVVSLLEEVGAEIELWQLPDDLFETHEGPLLTHDCLIDFHQSIEAHDRLVALIQ